MQDANSIDKIPFFITGVMGVNEFLEYKDGKYTATVEIADNAVTSALRLELPRGCVDTLVNAVVHRDYSNDGRDIKIGIFDDVFT